MARDLRVYTEANSGTHRLQVGSNPLILGARVALQIHRWKP